MGRPTQAEVAALSAAYWRAVAVAAEDHTVLACNPGSLLDVGLGWAPLGARLRVGGGHDGADWELLEVLESERVDERFTGVVIASGDGIFAPMTARLTSAGCPVTVVSRRSSLSRRLQMAAARVVYLPERPAIPAAAVSALRSAA